MVAGGWHYNLTRLRSPFQRPYGTAVPVCPKITGVRHRRFPQVITGILRILQHLGLSSQEHPCGWQGSRPGVTLAVDDHGVPMKASGSGENHRCKVQVFVCDVYCQYAAGSKTCPVEQ